MLVYLLLLNTCLYANSHCLKMMLYIIKMPKAGLQDQYIYLNYTERKLYGVGCLLGPVQKGVHVYVRVYVRLSVCVLL